MFNYICLTKSSAMTDRDIERLIDLAKELQDQAKTMTKKEALMSLNRAGILTMKGKFMKPYRLLETVIF